MNLTLENLKSMFESASCGVAARERELSELDSVCGDGDHGSAITGAMRAASAAVAGASDIKGAFFEAGFAAMSHSNGSTSTLLGSFFMGISDGIEAGAGQLGAAELARAFKSGLEGIRANTKADIGDKTLMDALIPAVGAMSGRPSVAEVLSAAAKAAKDGADSTAGLRAKFGRARNLGEKSIGSLDAGAVSMSIIFAEFAKAFGK